LFSVGSGGGGLLGGYLFGLEVGGGR